MRTQRELDIIREEQRRRIAQLKEAFLKQFLGERYKLLPPPPGEAIEQPKDY